MITLRGLNNYKRKSERQKERLKSGAADFIRAHVRVVLRDLAANTPQWSGNLAASWVVETPSHPANYGDETPFYNEDWEDQKPVRFIGDKAAVRYVQQNNEAAIKSIRWNSTITIKNVAYYAEDLATDPDVKLRPGNYIPGDVLAVAYISAKYKLGNNLLASSLMRTMDFT